ncbi:hypothetical protein BV911_14505 [Pseudoruegeria sp. SK021]|nr:hypothetical protein BV911_14505 [Pseudoruegeria sp. SK021]
MADKAFLDDPGLVLIRPMPTANTIGSGKNLNFRAVGGKFGLSIGSQAASDGRRRSITVGCLPQEFISKETGTRLRQD